MEEKIKTLVGEALPETIKELDLENCVAHPPAKLKILQPFTNLEYLNLKNSSLSSATNFPKLPNLKKLDLSGNTIASGLFLLNGCPQLTHLNLSGNKIKELSAVRQLNKLKNLQSLLLVNCEVTQAPYYRARVFQYIKSLMDLDGENKTLADQGPIPEEPKQEPGTPKKKRKAKEAGPIPKKAKTPLQDKNALMHLNEIKPGLKYVVESVSGPSHSPDFLVSVDVDGQRYTGNGSSKQLAKHAAAERVLISLGEFRDVVMRPQVRGVESMDFTMDNDENISFDSPSSNGKSGAQLPAKKQGIYDVTKNPVMLLHELHPGISYSFLAEDGTAASRRFCAVLNLEGETFQGYGPSKKQAKMSVARALLSAKYKINYSLPGEAMISDDAGMSSLPGLSQQVADQISQLVMTTFKEIMAGNDEHAKWKVIAGIVMTKDEEMKDMHVVGIATGTKCINGEHISMVGATVNDCHAEILTRRCLKDFIYTNLELHLEGEGDQSIFMKKEGGGFRLKPSIKFHLYISTAPCGDARIFCPHEEDVQVTIDRHPNRNSRGVLRTKIESGEGTIPVKADQTIQTWDSILPGQERLLTMSCSDKIARWNVTGVQGALLGYFVEPIYLESLVLGGLFQPAHLSRALVGRFEKHIGELPKLYKVNMLKISSTTSKEARHLGKSPSFSINWTTGQGRPEIVNATSGKTTSSNVSRLSKRSFFQRFTNIYERLPRIASYTDVQPPLYNIYKRSMQDYQTAKITVLKAFADAKLGNWMKKPAEQNEFELTF